MDSPPENQNRIFAQIAAGIQPAGHPIGAIVQNKTKCIGRIYQIVTVKITERFDHHPQGQALISIQPRALAGGE